MIVLSRSKNAAEFVRTLIADRAYVPLDIRPMDPYVRRTLPDSGSFCVPPPLPLVPSRTRRRAHAAAANGAASESKRSAGREEGSGAPGVVVTQRRFGYVGARG